MAGIYTHIPFCYTRCSYCDFYKTTDRQFKSDYINAICKELSYNEKFFNIYYIKTLYFGGGTPSVLNLDEWAKLFSFFRQYTDISTVEEITVEVNPDDVTVDYLEGLHQLGVNRVSMGIQSFVDGHLRKMNRRHNAYQAMQAIDSMKKSPIKNLSIDLIYGLPYMTNEEWERNVQLAIDADVQHISAYHLTIEKGTPYYDLLKKGKLKEIPEEQSSDQFDFLRQKLEDAGFENYEISNFSKPGYNSMHNSNYWTGEPYLGLGPSAHSYWDNSRRWNVRDIKSYIDKVNSNETFWKEESLSASDIYNERVMLGLRTSKGFEVGVITEMKDQEIKVFAEKELNRQVELGNVEICEGWCKVKNDKKFITDRIISDMFFVE